MCRSRPKDQWHLIAILLVSAFLISVGVGGMCGAYLVLGLPDISTLRSYRPPMVTEIQDATHAPIAYLYRERRWPVPRSRIPDRLVQAFLAAEDSRFYQHQGVDLRSVFRAVLRNVEAGGIVQGASTITQQVTRALLLSRQRTWFRKVKEAILAWQIDAFLSKDQILTMYLNQIYLGQGAYGVEAAARSYFGKHLDELNLAECALLAGLPQAPSRYNPVDHLDLARKRQAYVLKRMAEEGYITGAEAEEAVKAPIRLKPETLTPPPGSGYFLAEVIDELETRYGAERVRTDGLTVVTTMLPDLQGQAAKTMKRGMNAVCERHPGDKALVRSIQGALVALDCETGAVRALLGGKDFRENQFNCATQARRQPGSAFKPIVYAAALSRGVIAPNTVFVDEPISLPGATADVPWEPENFEKTFMGPITVRTALTYSRNIISVKVAQLVGLDPIHKLARRMGITAPLAPNLSIALGSSGVPLIELVQAYTAFPNGGRKVRPQFIQEVRDRNGRVLETLQTLTDPALDPVTAYQMVHLLRSVVEEGTGRCATRLGRPVAGKTGTTDRFRDAWFVGFTPQLTAGVWIGREDNQSLGERETGGLTACPVWTDFMERAVRGEPATDFSMPQGIALVPVRLDTGDIVAADVEQTIWEALPETDLPPLNPPSWTFKPPSWLHLDGLPWINQRPSPPFEGSR